MVLDATLLNTKHYKVRIKGKVEQSRESSSTLSKHPPLHRGVGEVTTEKVANFTYLLKGISQKNLI